LGDFFDSHCIYVLACASHQLNPALHVTITEQEGGISIRCEDYAGLQHRKKTHKQNFIFSQCSMHNSLHEIRKFCSKNWFIKVLILMFEVLY